MKAGETALLSVSIDIEDMANVHSVVFTMISGIHPVTKVYPDDVTFIDGQFKIPLTQADTVALVGHFAMEAQVNFANASVVKTGIYDGFISSTIATTPITGNTPDGNETEVHLRVDSIVVYGGGSGEDGATYYPSVSAEGIISWTNDKDLPNPEPVNIMGSQGPKGDTGEQGPKGENGNVGPQGPAGEDLVNQGETITPVNGSVTLEMEANKRYFVSAPVSTVVLTAPSNYNPWDEFYIMFVTSADGCVVTAPAGWTYVAGSTTSFDAGKVYEWDAVSGMIACPTGTEVTT